jgi:hypothetical protein
MEVRGHTDPPGFPTGGEEAAESSPWRSPMPKTSRPAQSATRPHSKTSRTRVAASIELPSALRGNSPKVKMPISNGLTAFMRRPKPRRCSCLLLPSANVALRKLAQTQRAWLVATQKVLTHAATANFGSAASGFFVPLESEFGWTRSQISLR